jgi:hypothetical protein
MHEAANMRFRPTVSGAAIATSGSMTPESRSRRRHADGERPTVPPRASALSWLVFWTAASSFRSKLSRDMTALLF